MSPRISAHVSLTKDEIIHLYSGGLLNLTIKGREAEARIELSCSDAPHMRSSRIRFKTISTD
jgi:hypothetical protein